MSFGYSIGDFIAIGQLCWNVYKACKGAAGEYEEISRELGTLHICLKNLEDEAACSTSILNRRGVGRKGDMDKILDNIREVLGELENMVTKYRSLGKLEKRKWDRLRFGAKDLNTIRGKLTFHTSAIDLFMSSLSAGSLAKIETALEELVIEIRAGRRAPTVLSVQDEATESATAWKELEADLVDSGITQNDIEKHKDSIRDYIRTLMSENAEDSGQSPNGSRSSSIVDFMDTHQDPAESEIWDSVSQRGPDEEDTAQESLVMTVVAESTPVAKPMHAANLAPAAYSIPTVGQTPTTERSNMTNIPPRSSIDQTSRLAAEDQADLLPEVSAAGNDAPSRTNLPSTERPATCEVCNEYLDPSLDMHHCVNVFRTLGQSRVEDTSQTATAFQIAEMPKAAENSENNDLVGAETTLTVVAKDLERTKDPSPGNDGLVSVLPIRNAPTEQGTPRRLEKLLNRKLSTESFSYTKSEPFVSQLLDLNGFDIDARPSDQRLALLWACSNGKIAVVRLLVEDSFAKGLNSASKKEESQLFIPRQLEIAARNGHQAVVQLLLSKFGESLNIRSALCQAIQSGHESVARCLILERADSLWTRPQNRLSYYWRVQSLGEVAFEIAYKEGQKAIAHFLLDRDFDAKRSYILTETTLKLAATNGDLDTVRRLVEKGVIIDKKDGGGWTALELAAGNGHETIVQFLLENGANPSRATTHGRTSLDIAAAKGHGSIVQMLLENGADTKGNAGKLALFEAASFGDPTILHTLIRRGIDVNRADWSEKSALDRAAEKGHKSIVQLLIQNGADFGRKNWSGKTAADIAAEGGHVEVMQVLLEKDSRLMYTSGKMPLFRAAANGHLEVIRLMKRWGADLKATDSFGKSALDRAAERGHDPVVKFLIQNWEGIVVKGPCGKSPMDWAAENGRLSTVQLLLEENVSAGVIKSAFFQAISNGHLKIVEFLELYGGVGGDSKDASGNTATGIAILNIHESIVEHLMRPITHERVVQLLLEGGKRGSTLQGYKYKKLCEAAAQGNRELVVLILQDSKLQNSSQYVALELAAENGHEEIVREMLVRIMKQKLGLRTKPDSDRIQKAFHKAVEKGHEKVVELLLAKRIVDINLPNDHGETVLDVAVSNGDGPMANLLLQWSASIETTNRTPGSPSRRASALYKAAQIGDLGFLKQFCDKEGQVNEAHTSSRRTPLHAAAINGHRDAVVFLIGKGAKVDMRDYDFRTALDLAAAAGHADVVNTLLGNGTPITRSEYDGRTALHLAAENGHEAVVQALSGRPNITEWTDWSERTAVELAVQNGHSHVVQLLRQLELERNVRPGVAEQERAT